MKDHRKERTEARKKAEKLVSQMTLLEKASQLKYDAAPVKRLGVPAYNYWNEAGRIGNVHRSTKQKSKKKLLIIHLILAFLKIGEQIFYCISKTSSIICSDISLWHLKTFLKIPNLLKQDFCLHCRFF